jgi:hypothetical protein
LEDWRAPTGTVQGFHSRKKAGVVPLAGWLAGWLILAPVTDDRLGESFGKENKE